VRSEISLKNETVSAIIERNLGESHKSGRGLRGLLGGGGGNAAPSLGTRSQCSMTSRISTKGMYSQMRHSAAQKRKLTKALDATAGEKISGDGRKRFYGCYENSKQGGVLGKSSDGGGRSGNRRGKGAMVGGEQSKHSAGKLPEVMNDLGSQR